MFHWLRGLNSKEKIEDAQPEVKPEGMGTIDLNPFGTSDSELTDSQGPTEVLPELVDESATEVWAALEPEHSDEEPTRVEPSVMNQPNEINTPLPLMMPSLRVHANLLRAEAARSMDKSGQVLWESYLQLVPTDSGAWLSLGESHLAHGAIGDAERVFRTAVEKHPEDGISKGALGHTLMLLGQLQEARRLLEEACEQLPEEIGLQETLLSCLTAAGDETAAHQQKSLIEDLRRGVR